ncbi:TonB family protein [Mucilaginibacter sp. PAMB04168]|uniref:energy transducer TonB n=1 Tax=Mucilaginibacter sp. PAMB04168 TaxID=3138567 RepID=UPI0031F7198B
MLNPKFDLYKTEWLDLVFAGRNKNYGAYDLRAHYGENMLKALAVTVLGFTVAAVSLTIVFGHKKPAEVIIDRDFKPTKYVEPPKVEKPIEAKLKPQAQGLKTEVTSPKTDVASRRYVEPVVTNNPVTTEPTPIDERVISNVNNEGKNNQPVLNTTTQVGPGNGPITDPRGSGEGTTNDPVTLDGLDVMPEPYGGAAAWSRFLQKNIRYPDTEVQGRVVISFIIEKDGRLTDLQVIKGVVSELDREAMRVLKLAPAWKPGMQNGKPVRVKYTIPIVFQMQE